MLFRSNKVEVIPAQTDDANATPYVVEANKIIIATGARANSLPFAPIDGNKIISYREALVPTELPKSMAVIGSGAIGSELAYFYCSMGVEVHLIEYLDQIVPIEDADVAAQLSRNFRKIGMKVLTSAQVKSVDTSGENCKLTIDTKKGEVELEVEKVLSAVGVVPNTQNLGLEELGVQMNRAKIVVDDSYMTSVKGVYAIDRKSVV